MGTQCGGSFEHRKHMFELMGKKLIARLRPMWLSESYIVWFKDSTILRRIEIKNNDLKRLLIFITIDKLNVLLIRNRGSNMSAHI